MKNRLFLSIFTISALSISANAQINLDKVTVTAADRFATLLKNTTANVTIITSDEIKERGYTTLKDALSHISSIAFASYGGNGQLTSIFMRGFNSGNVQILLNGVPLKDPTDPSFSSSIANLTLFNVERIEVTKGAQSGIWGADAVAGVINIVTKKDTKEAYIGYGKYKTKKAGFTFGQDFGKISFNISGNYYKTDGFSAMAPRSAEADGYDHKDINLEAGVKITDNSKFKLFYNHINGKADFDNSYPRNPDSTIEKSKFIDNLFGAEYMFNNEDLKVRLKASKNNIKRDLKGTGWRSKYQGKAIRYTFDIQKTIGKHLINGGLEYNKYKYDDSFLKTDFNNKAIWLGYGYTFNDILNAKTIFNATIRYDKFDKFKNKFTYRVGIKRYCNAIEGLHSGFNVYSAYKVPSLYQFSYKRDTLLKPESTNGFELTLGYKELLNITYFYNRTKDAIKYDYATFKYYNVNYKEIRKGIEVSSRYNFEKLPLIVGFNYTHLFSIKDKNGNYYLRVPKNSANFFIDYYPTQNILFSADIQYIGNRYDIGNIKLKSYTLVNLHYNQKINENLSFNITAKNIFNRKYEEIKGYSTPGRTIEATLSYKF